MTEPFDPLQESSENLSVAHENVMPVKMSKAFPPKPDGSYPLNSNKSISIPSMSRLTTKDQRSLGPYQSLKLSFDDTVGSHKLIELLTINSESAKPKLSSSAIEFMGKQKIYPISIVLFTGPPKCGKSFFIDRALNLGGYAGNHFLKASNPGIYLWGSPLVSPGKRVFLAEAVALNQIHLRELIPFINILASTVVAVDMATALVASSLVFSQMESFQQKLSADNPNEQIVTEIQRTSLYHLSRQQNTDVSLNQRIVVKSLPNARSPKYKGTHESLSEVSFFQKQVVNEHYVRFCSQFIQELVSKAEVKQLKEVKLSGSLLIKLLQSIEHQNNKSHIWQPAVAWKTIIKDLYQKAYQLSLLHYEQQIRNQLSDEEPKPLEDIVDLLSECAESANCVLNECAYDEQQLNKARIKLNTRIEAKQKMLLQINADKTIKTLKNELSKYLSPIQQWKILQSFRPELNHHRARLVIEVAQQTASGVDQLPALEAQASALGQQLKSKQFQLNEVSMKNAAFVARKEEIRKNILEHERVMGNISAVHQLDEQVQALRKQVHEKQKVLQKFSSTVNDIASKRTQLQNQVQAKNRQISEVENQIKDSQERIDLLKKKQKELPNTLEEKKTPKDNPGEPKVRQTADPAKGSKKTGK